MRYRPTELVIDLDAIRHNLKQVRAAAPNAAICATVKAHAYGHGLVQVGMTLDRAGVEWLGVALVEEGLALRAAGVRADILVLTPSYLQADQEIVAYGLVPALFRVDHLTALAQAAGEVSTRFHLKIDTGMGRLGLAPNELDSFLTALKNFPNLKLDGIFTHFANADLGDWEFNSRQLEIFRSCQHRILQHGFIVPWVHVANSAAVLSFPEARQSMVRPGLMVYGLDPRGPHIQGNLRPAMRWTTKPIHIKTVPAGTKISYGGKWIAPRESRIATLPVGYADGYPRLLSNRGQVLLLGKRAPIVGAICMDLLMIDVTNHPPVTLTDEVVLMGQQGKDTITAYEMAKWADTIAYEIICGIGPRVPRQYLDSTNEQYPDL